MFCGAGKFSVGRVLLEAEVYGQVSLSDSAVNLLFNAPLCYLSLFWNQTWKEVDASTCSSFHHIFVLFTYSFGRVFLPVEVAIPHFSYSRAVNVSCRCAVAEYSVLDKPLQWQERGNTLFLKPETSHIFFSVIVAA